MRRGSLSRSGCQTEQHGLAAQVEACHLTPGSGPKVNPKVCEGIGGRTCLHTISYMAFLSARICAGVTPCMTLAFISIALVLASNSFFLASVT
jgi:hypothetical protein